MLHRKEIPGGERQRVEILDLRPLGGADHLVAAAEADPANHREIGLLHHRAVDVDDRVLRLAVHHDVGDPLARRMSSAKRSAWMLPITMVEDGLAARTAAACWNTSLAHGVTTGRPTTSGRRRRRFARHSLRPAAADERIVDRDLATLLAQAGSQQGEADRRHRGQ